MIGRGIFSNPWIFNKKVNPALVTHKEKFELLIKHIELFEKTWGRNKNPDILKKFYKVYVSGIPDAAEFRAELMQYKTAQETVEALKKKLQD